MHGKWSILKWPFRSQIGQKNVVRPALRDKLKIYLPTMHIKLDLIKYMWKRCIKKAKGLSICGKNFPKYVRPSRKKKIFVGPQITPIRRTKLSSKIKFYIKDRLEGI
jgi:5-formyltetrahydrofolate cyclo-ligase